MRPIAAPLGPTDQGGEVVNLQAGLTLLVDRQVVQTDPGTRTELLNGLAQESQAQVYRAFTRKAVGLFQEQRKQAQTGVVDADTAAALNEALRSLGALDDGHAVPGQRTVAGQVVQDDQTPFGGRVILVEEDAAGQLRLGEDSTDPEGHYAITYTLPDGADGVKLRIAAFDAERQRRAEATFTAGKTVQVVNLVVQGDGRLFRVTGRVFSDVRAGVGGLRVVVVDANVGGGTVVAETTTAADGTYHVAFTYGGVKAKPDLQARTFSGETLLGTSEVRYRAANEETLNIPVAGDAQAMLATEHETLTAAVATHFTGDLRDLQESDDRHDLTYLANATGWDARAVALAALADNFGAGTADPTGVPAIAPALFYALFRAGVPANDAALYRTDVGSVEAIWKIAIAQGIVPASLADDLPATLETFTTLSARHALTGPPVAGRSSLGELLKVSLPNASPAQQEQFARLRIQHQGDPDGFWNAVTTTFGAATAQRLQVDGQFALLTLNHARVIDRLRRTAGDPPLTGPVDLIARGYHRREQWLPLIDTTPPEIPGADDEEKRANYADVLAAQLRLSYPTATVAAMVASGETPTAAAPANEVSDFLRRHQKTYDIGMQPIGQFARSGVEIDADVQREITRIQRVRQVTPSDDAMNALLRRGIDSAAAVARYDRTDFVSAYKDELGGETQAALIHARAQQVHTAVLSLATSYLLAGTAPGTGDDGLARLVDPARGAPANAGDVIAFPTLEQLLGELDYCDCEHCRSVLSPAAYLVDLLQFLDRDDLAWERFRTGWRQDHGAPYPFETVAAWEAAGKPNDTAVAPLQVLLSRRPDLQHTPLTCENTNTPLPYIDLVNETLEYFVTNGLTLQGFQGHTTDDRATPEELLADPQFVQDAAYDVLAGKGSPPPLLPPAPPLPFSQSLERLRRLFDTFGAPLPRVMEALRTDDALERATDAGYGWRDIWMEQLGLSRAEYTLLTDRSVTLQRLYGFPATTSQDDTLAGLSNAKAFAERVAISYDELIELLRTRFVNPNGVLIPNVERLGVPLATLKAFKDGAITAQQFDDALAPQVDASAYGGDIKAWVKNQANYDKIMGLLVLADPIGANPAGGFDAFEFRYADPARLTQRVRPFEFVRLLRFIRLWRKLGWSIEQTDRAITALYPADQNPDDADDTVNLQRLDAGFLALLPRFGVLARVVERLNLRVKADLAPLLACFAPMDTYGPGSLYRALFGDPALLRQDPVFADDGQGNVLDGSAKLLDHAEALRAALTLTGDELTAILAALGFTAETPLTVATMSAVFRRGWLARRLKLSVKELLLLIARTGIDPFAAIDPVRPAILGLLDLVNRLHAARLKPAQALYLIWNDDLSGTSAPASSQVNEFVRSLRAGFTAVESEFGVADDPDGQITRARMALVYDNRATDLFFGLLNNTFVCDTTYSHPQLTLEQPILDAAPGQISYDDFRKRLSFAGAMTSQRRDALKSAAMSAAFAAAMDTLYDENQQIVAPFFARYPELSALYDAYVASNDPPEKKRSALLANFLPVLSRRRKRQQASEAISAAAGIDSAFAAATLDNVTVLHAVADPALSALDDLVAVEQPALAAKFFFRDTVGNHPDRTSDAEASLDYRPDGPNHLPGTANGPISAIWSGYVEAPASDFYQVRIDADAGAQVRLFLGGARLELALQGTRWSNVSPIELRAGTLYAVTLIVENVRETFRVSWQTTGRGWEVPPARYLYSATLRDHLFQGYTRFFKAASLARALKLTADEFAHLAAHADYRIGGQGWLNTLPVSATPDEATAKALNSALGGLLDFASLKAGLSPDDERLLGVLRGPQTAAKPDGPLFTLTRWDAASLQTLLARFNVTAAGLEHLAVFRRVYAAFEQLTALGIAAPALIGATTNEPTATAVRDLQGALRARYATSDWLSVVKPINDDLRGRQRDALVAYILHQMRVNPGSAHIDTPDKLFEYFLMDVQMQPCTQTSRIRNALSAAQLFIERSLMNLEPRVAASAINGAQWEWMKRYRVWEANRKVFLWPENWLEPELRDDQSPFFKELMNELLQGDITEDRAATALGTYLGKLDTVAKLEPCGIHLVENDPGTADDTAYVVARTGGAGRTYCWRRRENGSWTPWERIQLDIEDNPVIPVLWKNRLFLFWLKILQEPDLTAQRLSVANPSKSLAELPVVDIQTAPPPVTVRAMVCWSEYYNGAWQPTRTSDPSRPTTVQSIGPAVFNRAALRLSSRQEGDSLRIVISGFDRSSFLFRNSHSAPIREEDEFPPFDFFMEVLAARRDLSITDRTLTAIYTPAFNIIGEFGYPSRALPVLKDRLAAPVDPKHQLATTAELSHRPAKPWDAPFFYSDGRHVFAVSTQEQPFRVATWQGYGGSTAKPPVSISPLPPIVLPPVATPPDRTGPVVSGRNNGIGDPAPIERFVSEDAYITKGLGTIGTVRFGDTEIGPAGALPKQR